MTKRAVQEYYTRWELKKPEYAGLGFPAAVESLKDRDLEDLIKELSIIRRNEMFERLVLGNLSWEEKSLKSQALYTIGVGSLPSDILQSIGGRVEALARIWGDESDPRNSVIRREFGPFSGPEDSATLIVVLEAGGRPRVADGIHRGVGLAILGRSEIPCLVGG